jgi:hypothetical protein
MKTSGVSRFLSRRDKHHEKRSSKTTPSKVRLSPSASCSSLTPLLPRTENLRRGHQRHSKSLETLYHKLPNALRSSVEDGFLFFQWSSPNRAAVTFAIAWPLLDIDLTTCFIVAPHQPCLCRPLHYLHQRRRPDRSGQGCREEGA